METKKQLKNSVKELAALGRAIRTEKIRTSSGPDRAAAWEEKRKVGGKSRANLLAYAFVRERPYRSCEPRVREPNHVTYSVAVDVASALLDAEKVGFTSSGLQERVAAVRAWMQAETEARQAA